MICIYIIFCQYLMKVGRKREDRKVIYKLLLTRAKYWVKYLSRVSIFYNRHFKAKWKIAIFESETFHIKRIVTQKFDGSVIWWWVRAELSRAIAWLSSARDLFHFSSKSKLARKRAEIRFSVEDLFLINFYNKFVLEMTKLCS